jgi:hypothetical protein
MQVHSKKNLSLIIIIYLLNVIMLSSTYATDNNTQDKSSLDIQQIQTRVYKGTYNEVYKSVVSVLQDNRFKITHTDKESGIISADGTPEASENMSDAVATIGGYVIPFFGAFQKKKERKWFLSCAVEELREKKIFVRINITAEIKKSGFFTKAKDKSKADDLTTTAPEIYQALFAKIDKALFLRQSLN